MQEAIGRATSIMVSCPDWQVSVKVDGEHNEADVMVCATEAAKAARLQMPFHTGQLDSMLRGDAVTRKARAVTEADSSGQEEGAQHAEAPRRPLTVRMHVPKQRAGDPPQGAQARRTRGSGSDAAARAGEREAQRVGKAEDRAKRVREETLAKAAARARGETAKRAKVAGKGKDKAQELAAGDKEGDAGESAAEGEGEDEE